GKNDQPRALITSVMLPPKGIATRVTTMSDPIVFSFDEGLDRSAYEALPSWLQKIVASSLEYEKATSPQTAASTEGRLKAHLGGSPVLSKPAADDDLDDVIPF